MAPYFDRLQPAGGELAAGISRCQLPSLFPRGYAQWRQPDRDGRTTRARRCTAIPACGRGFRQDWHIGTANSGTRRRTRFLLLSDLGSTTYLNLLNNDTAHKLYIDAIDALILLQTQSKPGVLPEYDRALLQRELQLFPDWYIGKHLQVNLSDDQTATLNKAFDIVLANNLAQAQVFVHRDYHSRNLMVLPNGSPGIIDFQDAVYGPITYDLVSLLRDAYIQWDEEMVLDWVIRYWERAKRAGLPVAPDIDSFYRDFEFMGLQRHLKVLGIFARLYHRDGKDAYLKDIPLVMEYTLKAARRYTALTPLVRLIEKLEDKAPKVGYTF